MDKEKEDFFIETLKNNCKKVGNCLEWTGKTNQGYGYVHVFKKTWLIHRVSYLLEKGSIPEGFYVLHICNNKKCINPHHLYAGTAKENTEDFLASNEYESSLEKKFQTRKENIEYKNNHSPIAEFISIEDTAKIFSVHPHTIRRAIRLGYLTAIRIGMGVRSPYRISRKSIEAIHMSIIKDLATKAGK